MEDDDKDEWTSIGLQAWLVLSKVNRLRKKEPAPKREQLRDRLRATGRAYARGEASTTTGKRRL